MIALAILIFTTVATFLSSIQSAPAAFAGDEGFVISETSAPTIFSSQIPVGMVDALRSIPDITAASPEIFSFSSWNGVSFVVRGRGGGFGDAFEPSSEELTMKPGWAGDSEHAAFIGSRLLERLDLADPFSTIPLAGSYSSRMEFVQIVGHFRTGTSMDDELVVPIDVARFLSGMPAGKVSIVRVATTDPGWLSSMLSPRDARFALLDLHLSNAVAALDEPLEATVRVQNWGQSRGSVEVSFWLDGVAVGKSTVVLNASSSQVVSQQVQSGEMGTHSLQASISGSFPVRLFTNFTVVDPYLQVAAPSTVLLGSNFNVTVTTYSGESAAGAAVVFAGQAVFADLLGKAELTAPELGSFALNASLTGYSDGTATVRVADPSEFPDTFDPAVISFVLSPAQIEQSEEARGVVVVENRGLVPGSYIVEVSVDSLPSLSFNVTLSGLSSATVRFSIGQLQPGEHTVQVGNLSSSVTVVSWYADNPGLVNLVVRYGDSSALSSSASIPIYQAAKISEQNVSAALFAIGAISALLAVLAISSVFSKELMEHRRAFGVLKTVGATRSEAGRLVLRQALSWGLIGASVGVALGVAATLAVSRAGAILLFGHEVVMRISGEALLLIIIGAALISILSSIASMLSATRGTVIGSIRGHEYGYPVGQTGEEDLGDD